MAAPVGLTPAAWRKLRRAVTAGGRRRKAINLLEAMRAVMVCGCDAVRCYHITRGQRQTLDAWYARRWNTEAPEPYPDWKKAQVRRRRRRMGKGWTIGSSGWVTGSIFGFNVEKNEVKRPGGEAYLVLDEDSKLGNLHTSEGFTIDGLVATLKSKGFAGQWCVGQGRIVQTRPLWAQGSLLLGGSATNKPMRMEVEQVAFTKSTLWQPDPPTFNPMVALAAFYAVEFGVPLKVPLPSWKDNGSDISPAYFGDNNRRKAAAFAGLGNLTGWIHHCEVPQNLHADCGSYNRTALFAAAKSLVDSLSPGGDDWMAEFTEAELDRLKKLAAGDQLVGFRDGMIQGDKGEPLKPPSTGKFAEAGRKLLAPSEEV